MIMRGTSVTAILVGVLVSAGLLLILGLSLTGAPDLDPAWGKYGPKYLLYDLVATLASAVAGGVVTSLRAETTKLGHSVVLGIVLLVCFLLAAFDPQDPAWYTTTAVLLMVPAAALGGYVGKSRTARLRAAGVQAPGARRNGIGGAGWVAGLIVAGIGVHLLVDRMGIGFTESDAVALAIIAGFAGLLIGTAIAAPRPRVLRAMLVVLCALVVPVGGFVLFVRLSLGLSTLTASAASPDGRMAVQLVDPDSFLDRNFSLRLRGSSWWWRHIWLSPDEGPPGGERFVWSRDGRYVLLVGPNFFALPESCLASGEYLYLHLDTRSGAVRNNATQTRGPRFALADLAGVEFTAPLAAAGRSVILPGGTARCEPASAAR